jgi:hypothetical protein
MGGFNSGRYGGRPTVESGLTLDLYKLILQRLFRPGQNLSGSIVGTRVGSGERVGSVGYKAHMAGDHGHVRLQYTTTHAYSGEKRDTDYTIALATTPQPFGGGALVVRVPKDRRPSCPSFICRTAPTSLPLDALTGSDIGPSARARATVQLLEHSSFATVSEAREELAITSQSRNGYVGGLTIAKSPGSRRPSASTPRTYGRLCKTSTGLAKFIHKCRMAYTSRLGFMTSTRPRERRS